MPYEEDGAGQGGYAKEMSDEYKAAEQVRESASKTNRLKFGPEVTHVIVRWSRRASRHRPSRAGDADG